MPVQTFNAELPVSPQITDYSCSVGATFWCLRSLNVDLTQEDLQARMVPALVSPDLGLLDGTGATLARFLGDQFGLTATNVPNVSFDDIASRAGHQPIAVGGHRWHITARGGAVGHWVGVRDFDGTQLLLANPGGTGPNFGQQALTPADFEQRGPFSAVWIEVPAGPELSLKVCSTDGEGGDLRSDPSPTASVIKSLPEGMVVSVGDHAWRQLIGADGDDGWMAEDFLAPVDGHFQIANTGGEGANLRSEPDSGGDVIKLLAEGTQVSGAVRAWRQVTDADGTQGWMANDLLVADS